MGNGQFGAKPGKPENSFSGFKHRPVIPRANAAKPLLRQYRAALDLHKQKRLAAKGATAHGCVFYDETVNLFRADAGWYLLDPGSRVTVLFTFENGRWTLGIALPTPWAPLDISRLPARKSTTCGSGWRYRLSLTGHLDVVLECSGGQTATETFNVAEQFQ